MKKLMRNVVKPRNLSRVLLIQTMLVMAAFGLGGCSSQEVLGEDVNEIFPNATLSDDVLADLSVMDFYFPRTFTIYPDPERTASFDGKVWLLVNYNNFSATQHIASLFHQTGFATLVGETTGGAAIDVGLDSQYFYLPNTGFLIRYDTAYIVSEDGRPWEYGTQPHHFNREGMDALETVLALIAEGNY